MASGRTMQQIAEARAGAPNPSCSPRPRPAKPMRSGTATAPRSTAARVRRRRGRPGPPPRTSRPPRPPNRRASNPSWSRHSPHSSRRNWRNWSDRPPDRADWAHEVKFDGYRAQLRVEGGKAVIRTRKGLDWTERFRAIANEAGALPDCIIDGEIVALDEHQLPNFGALQAALSAEKSDDLVFYAFDLLFEGREDLRALALSERKARLEKLLGAQRAGGQIRYVAHLQSNAEAVLASACKIGLEGIVSKKLDAPYTSGRSDRWLKAKCRAGQEVVLGGWTTEAGTVRSLLAGVYRDGQLRLRRPHRHRLRPRGRERVVAQAFETYTREEPVCRSQCAAEGAQRPLAQARSDCGDRIRGLDRFGHDSPGRIQGLARGQGSQRGRRGDSHAGKIERGQSSAQHPKQAPPRHARHPDLRR